MDEHFISGLYNRQLRTTRTHDSPMKFHVSVMDTELDMELGCHLTAKGVDELLSSLQEWKRHNG